MSNPPELQDPRNKLLAFIADRSKKMEKQIAGARGDKPILPKRPSHIAARLDTLLGKAGSIEPTEEEKFRTKPYDITSGKSVEDLEDHSDEPYNPVRLDLLSKLYDLIPKLSVSSLYAVYHVGKTTNTPEPDLKSKFEWKKMETAYPPGSDDTQHCLSNLRDLAEDKARLLKECEHLHSLQAREACVKHGVQEHKGKTGECARSPELFSGTQQAIEKMPLSFLQHVGMPYRTAGEIIHEMEQILNG